MMQPGVVSQLISILSCRNIAGTKFIMADLRYECYTDDHIIYMAVLVIPSLIFWGALIPIFIFRTLLKNKNNLNNTYTRISIGFLYQDYKYKYYYWEIMKSLMKVFIVAIHNILIEYKIFETSLIIIVLFIYIIVSLQLHPIIY
jgi:hypothetical protein